MAETGDIVAGATGIGAFFGALFGAWKIFKPAPMPEKENDNMTAWVQHVNEQLSSHEARLNRAEKDRTEDREDFGLIFAELKALGKSSARIEGALGIGGEKQ